MRFLYLLPLKNFLERTGSNHLTAGWIKLNFYLKSLKKLILKSKLEWLCLFEWILSEKQKRCKKKNRRDLNIITGPVRSWGGISLWSSIYVCNVCVVALQPKCVSVSLLWMVPRWNFLSIFIGQSVNERWGLHKQSSDLIQMKRVPYVDL